ncbi:hypothetical protein F5050DRAFT_1713541 [Lentinula boryana]|uniref:Uncharacterized protein n=1 Tax=Lentinula boryana TaxID=40481 RepID=A0ABQ8Q7Y6_9AGAR|nr:hypothetical protein F5050DRAFT_1713541 [Lentinula boryana]
MSSLFGALCVLIVSLATLAASAPFALRDVYNPHITAPVITWSVELGRRNSTTIYTDNEVKDSGLDTKGGGGKGLDESARLVSTSSGCELCKSNPGVFGFRLFLPPY